jgi:hypothetical protein
VNLDDHAHFFEFCVVLDIDHRTGLVVDDDPDFLRAGGVCGAFASDNECDRSSLPSIS